MTALTGREEADAPSAPPAPATNLIQPDPRHSDGADKKPTLPVEILPMLSESSAWPRVFPGL